jgi:mRNA interferase RelE/StbE
MADFAVAFIRSARKELESIDFRMRARILSAIEKLAKDPMPAGCKKLRDSANRWRIRIGDFRVVYSYNPQTKLIEIIAVRHRSDAYR